MMRDFLRKKMGNQKMLRQPLSTSGIQLKKKWSFTLSTNCVFNVGIVKKYLKFSNK
jgi:hypothetical protein